MDPIVNRFRSTAIFALALALFPGSGCTPNGAHFSPVTGVLTVYGTANADVRIVSISGGLIVVNGGQIPIQDGVATVANTTRIEIRGREGSDFLELDESGGALPDGVLVGGAGADVLIGGSGDDQIDGGEGDDIVFLGGGDDTALWSEGGGLDTVEGEEGFDTLRFQGLALGESIDVSNNAGRVRFFENVGNVTTDLGGVEAIDYRAAGGTDAIVVNDLVGTELTKIDIDLAGTFSAPDGAADTITISGTQGDDVVDIAGQAVGVLVSGLQASVHVTHAEPTSDRVILNVLGGADQVDATAPGSDGIQLAVNGGIGIDVFNGGEGDDAFSGGDGNDVAFGGGGDDTFTWSPGDDNDTLDGEAGFDTLLFNGAIISETIDISAVGGRARFTRNIALVAMDLGTLEAIDFLARGGNDVITVNDLSTTDVVEVDLDLAATTGGVADGTADAVFVNGTPGADAVQVLGDASEVSVVGLAADVNITSPDGTLDGLTVSTFGGDDLVHAAALTTPSLTLTADGGDQDDVLIGGDGVDILLGGDGDDLLQGGPGVDVLDGGLGHNTVIQ